MEWPRVGKWGQRGPRALRGRLSPARAEKYAAELGCARGPQLSDPKVPLSSSLKVA